MPFDRKRLERRAALERTSAIFMAFDRLQNMLLSVEWVRQASGNRYACAFCKGITERDGGDGHVDGCEWVEQTSRDFMGEFSTGLDRSDDEWLREIWRSVGGGRELTGPLIRFAAAVHRRALSSSAREAQGVNAEARSQTGETESSTDVAVTPSRPEQP